MAVSRLGRMLLLLASIGVAHVLDEAAAGSSTGKGIPLSSLSREQLDEQLQVRLMAPR